MNTEIAFPLRRVVIPEHPGNHDENERGQIRVGEHYLRAVSMGPRELHIAELYTAGETISEIARLAGCSNNTIYKVIRTLGIPTRYVLRP